MSANIIPWYHPHTHTVNNWLTVNSFQLGCTTRTIYNKLMVIWEVKTLIKDTVHSCKCYWQAYRNAMASFYFGQSIWRWSLQTWSMYTGTVGGQLRAMLLWGLNWTAMKKKKVMAVCKIFVTGQPSRQRSQQWKNGQINDRIKKPLCNVWGLHRPPHFFTKIGQAW